MRTEFAFGSPRKVERRADVVVHESLVTMLLWPSVPVLRRIEHDLTVIDRFVVEATISLAPMQPSDVEEITGVPRDAVARIADRLVGLGLLVRESTGYQATESAPEALLRRVIPELRPAYVTFLYLPDTDELIAYPPGPQTANPPMLQRVQPAGLTRLPDRLASQRRSELVQQRIDSTEVKGLPADIVEVLDSAELLPVNCPQYRCHGTIRQGEAGEVEFVLRLEGAGGNPVVAKIIGAQRLAAQWAEVAGRAAQACSGWTGAGGKVVATRKSGTRWSYELDGPSALAAQAEGIVTSEPAGLLIREGNDIIYVDAVFSPGDASARVVFAQHHAYQEVSSTPPAKVSSEVVERAAESGRLRFEVSPTAFEAHEVIAELWRNRRYQHVYAARRDEDFADA